VDELSVKEVAALLNTSGQTVRSMLREGVLAGRQEPKSRRWRVRRSSVERFLTKHGPLDGGRRRKSRASLQALELVHLRAEVRRLTEALGGPEVTDVVRERDDLRVRLATLEDALARVREAAELQRSADRERAQMVEHLLGAVAHGERADALRRRALQVLEDGLAAGIVARPPSNH
jgi:excisionase family DNA binding protein